MIREEQLLKRNQIYQAHDLEDIIRFVRKFSDGEMVWFRGNRNSNYTLLPTLYRDKSTNFFQKKSYNSMYMAEQLRIQQYYAKEYPFIKDGGHNTVEWLGMGQHFGINTRFLDWSVSALHSTIFAVEKYFEDSAYDGTDIPCLWVLKPQEMNRRIVDRILSEDWLEKCERYYHGRKEECIIKEWHQLIIDRHDEFHRVFVEADSRNQWAHLDYIYNIAYFDRILGLIKDGPKASLEQDIVNPLFVFLAMIYIDGSLILQDDVLDRTPLAVVHPLNSERIREQKGVFTVFPFPNSQAYHEMGDSLDYMRMEWNPRLLGVLCKIVMLHPERICRELREIGAHRSWLFNEPEYIAKEIESGL